MEELLRDLPTILTIVGIAVAIVIPIIIFFLERRKKSLSYEILTNTSLLTFDDEIEGKIRISYENTPVQKVHLLIFRIVNDGNLSITPSDFETRLTFDFGENTKVLSVEIIDTEPENLKPEFFLHWGREIQILPLLFNSKDSIKFKLLLAQFEGEIKVDARINGVREVKKKANPKKIRKLLWFLIAFLLGAILNVVVEALLESIGLSF